MNTIDKTTKIIDKRKQSIRLIPLKKKKENTHRKKRTTNPYIFKYIYICMCVSDLLAE